MDYLINRLKEASTWQAIVVFVAGMLHFVLTPELQGSLVTVAVSAFGMLGFAKKEAKSPDAVVNPQAVTNGTVEAAKAK